MGSVDAAYPNVHNVIWKDNLLYLQSLDLFDEEPDDVSAPVMRVVEDVLPILFGWVFSELVKCHKKLTDVSVLWNKKCFCNVSVCMSSHNCRTA